MMNSSIFLLLSFSIFVYGEDERCPESGWVRFGDAKCFKLVKKYSSGVDASYVCNQESPGSILAVVNSQEEQEFLTNYIFYESSVTISVWFGLMKYRNDIIWIDGSPITYTNWYEGNPTNETSKDCIEMVSQFQKLADGEWKDASCEKANYVICQKLQSWSITDLQRELIKLRAESNWKINELNNQVSEIKANPVPIGFIYVQLKDQPLPSVTWPEVTWTEISSSYAGLFFRVAGGNAASFGSIQEADTQRLRNVEMTYDFQSELLTLQAGQWSPKVKTGWTDGSRANSLRFYVQNNEIRPRNTAMRIWKRTA